MSKVHLILQGKGGVGKSFVASLLAQYHRENSKPAVLLDTDPVNATFSDYKSLGAQRVELMDGSSLNTRRFDEMMERILSEDADFIVDNGASSFIPLTNYMVENDAIGMLSGSGKQVVVHTIVAGGQMQRDTIQGFTALCSQLPESAQVVAWINEFQGPIEHDGKTFEQMKAYTTNRHRVAGLIRITRQTSETFGKDLELMLARKLTFADVDAGTEFGLMAKQRLRMIKTAIFGQMALAV